MCYLLMMRHTLPRYQSMMLIENQEYIQIIEYGDVDNDVSDLNLQISNSWLA